MTDKEKLSLIEILLYDKQQLESSIAIFEASIICKKEHLSTIENILDNLQD